MIAAQRCEGTEYSGQDQNRAVYHSGMWEQLRGTRQPWEIAGTESRGLDCHHGRGVGAHYSPLTHGVDAL